MKHIVATLIVLAVIFAGVMAEIKIEESYVKTTTETAAESVLSTEGTTIPTTTEKPTEATTEATTTEKETTTEQTATETTTESTKGSYLGRFYITGYTAEEGFPRGSATASGAGVREGYCALNNEQRKALGIKYGDYIYVEGLGTYQVMDCGCAYGVVDIWCYSNAEAYAMTGYYNVYR